MLAHIFSDIIFFWKWQLEGHNVLFNNHCLSHTDEDADFVTPKNKMPPKRPTYIYPAYNFFVSFNKVI